MPSNYPYRLQPNASGGFKAIVTQDMSFDQRLVAVTEVCVINQIAEDYAIRLANHKYVKEHHHLQTHNILYRFNDVKRKMNRVMRTKEQQNHFHESICVVVDDIEASLNWVEKMLVGELINRIKYEYVESTFLVGFVGGMVKVLQGLNKSLYGKGMQEYDVIENDLKIIDDDVSNNLLNEKQRPCLTNVNDALDKMFTIIRDKSIEFVKKSREERRCLQETLKA